MNTNKTINEMREEMEDFRKKFTIRADYLIWLFGKMTRRERWLKQQIKIMR